MKNTDFESCLGILTSLAAVLIVGTLLDGWALAKIWNWFIPPIFGLPVLNLWKAIGVSMVFELFIRNNKKAKEKSDTKYKSVWEVVLASLIEITLTPLMSVGIAYIVYQLAF